MKRTFSNSLIVEPLVLYDRLVDVGLGHEESRRRGSTVSRLSVRTATPTS